MKHLSKTMQNLNVSLRFNSTPGFDKYKYRSDVVLIYHQS